MNVNVDALLTDLHEVACRAFYHPAGSGEGLWYLLAYCEVSEEVRIFRMDRILAASPTGRPFLVPAEFDAGVVDPHWIVGHVLQYGADAEVLGPEEARGWVRGGMKALNPHNYPGSNEQY